MESKGPELEAAHSGKGVSLDGDWVSVICSQKHPLEEYLATDKINTCSRCHQSFPPQTSFLACRSCEFYTCRRCDVASAQARPESPPRLQLSVSENSTSKNKASPLPGITNHELHEAHVELSSILDGNKPQGLRLLYHGKMFNGGSWELHGEEDPDTGLLQLYVEGHFGVPLEVMQKCILDEAFQKTYDPYMVCKDVVPRCGEDAEKSQFFQEVDSTPPLSSAASRAPNSRSSSRSRGRSSRKSSPSPEHKGRLTPDPLLTSSDCETTMTSSLTDIIHHEIKFPRPFSNRDYVYYRRCLVQPGVQFTCVMRDVVPTPANHACVQPKKGVVRAGNGLYWQFVTGRAEPSAATERPSTTASASTKRPPPRRQSSGVARGKDAKGHSLVAPALGRCTVIIRSQDNVEARVPKWMQNFAAKTGAPGYIKQLEAAALVFMVKEGLVSEEDAKTWS